MKKETIKIKGMHCASCALNISKNLEKQAGVKSAQVNYVTEKASVEYDDDKIDLDKIKDTVVSSGYKVVSEKTAMHGHHDNHDSHHNHGNGDEKKQKWITFGAIILALPVVVRMFWAWEIPGEFLGISFTNWIEHDLTFIIVFFLGWQFHITTWKQLKKIQFGMDSLISLGTLVAYFYSTWAMFAGRPLFFESAAAITALILLGRYLETKTRGRANKAMKKLLELGSKKARLISADGQEKEVDVNEIKIGDIILVKPSEKIPLDGEVLEGSSSVDEAMITGESLPVSKEKGSNVFGATINKNGVLTIKVTQVGENTFLAQIIKTVEEAQNFKAPIQNLADKIASIFVPIVIVISVLTFAGWYFTTGNISVAIINAVAVLIISCPCALGIATPVAVMVGTSTGARNGILIKNGESFERAKIIDTIVFDKTGTLTKGEPKVAKIFTNNFSEEKVLKISASLAKNSEHPLSRAVEDFAKEKNIQGELRSKREYPGVDLVKMENVEEIEGMGLKAKCAEHKTALLLGNIKLLQKHKLDTSWADKVLDDNKLSDGTIIFVAHGDAVIGAILIADEIKETAREAIQEIKKMNIMPMMITGDNKNTARVVAEKIGIDKYLSEVMPNEKQAEIKKMQAEGKKVVFVGDGINDAPSLVQADLGIAMGSGTDIAKESGNIIIMKNDPVKVIEAIKLSQKTFKVIKQNLFWAFFYNVVAIPLAIAGFINPMIAAAAMSFSSITVISNSLRIYRK